MARKPYEFGVKSSLVVTHKQGLMVGARTFPGNPYDGHTLAAQLKQTGILLQDTGVKPTTAVVDLGFRGVDHDIAPVELIHRGKGKTLTAIQRKWLKRRQAIVRRRLKAAFLRLVAMAAWAGRLSMALQPRPTDFGMLLRLPVARGLASPA